MATDQTLFVNRTSGAIGRIARVDDSYAHLEIISPRPARYSMPRKEYDEQFAKRWRPAAPGESAGTAIPAPASVEPDWDPPVKIGEPY
jgi:hypothetical protein